MSSGCLARIQMLLTLKVLLKGATSVNSEIATQIHCLQERDLTPENSELIECNLAAVLSVSCR